MDSTTLVIILLIALIFIGILYGISLNKKIQKLQLAKPTRPDGLHVEGTRIFAEMDMKSIESFALDQMKVAAEKSAAKLQESLTVVASKVAEQLSDIATKNLDQEFKNYRVSLESLRSESVAQFTTIQKNLNDHYIEQIAKIDKTLAAETTRQIETLYSRINDIISGYVIDSLGANVDLSAQSAAIIAELEKHKEDIKRDLS